MTFSSDPLTQIVSIALGVSWLAIFLVLAAGRRGASKAPSTREAKSHIGFALQCITYGICIAFERPHFSILTRDAKFADALLATAAIALAFASAWFCYAAARTLGKQWSLVARVFEGHELVQRGPYAIVRNPIYLAMLGMLLATGIAVSRWEAFAVALMVFAAGTAIRIQSEEKLLRAAFGPAFTEYSRAVPAFFPRLT